jgi:hypothetical protein
VSRADSQDEYNDRSKTVKIGLLAYIVCGVCVGAGSDKLAHAVHVTATGGLEQRGAFDLWVVRPRQKRAQ